MTDQTRQLQDNYLSGIIPVIRSDRSATFAITIGLTSIKPLTLIKYLRGTDSVIPYFIHPRVYLKVRISSRKHSKIRRLIDTGAEINIVTDEYLRNNNLMDQIYKTKMKI
jgi:hypothetical protein